MNKILSALRKAKNEQNWGAPFHGQIADLLTDEQVTTNRIRSTRRRNRNPKKIKAAIGGLFFQARKKAAASLVAIQTPEIESQSSARVKSPLLPISSTSFEIEPYRVLAHMVVQLHKDVRLRTLAIGSPQPGDGKTSTAINLAGILAQAPAARVLLVETDLRRPSIARYLDIRNATTSLLEAVLNPELTLDSVVYHCQAFNLDIVLAGHPVASPADLLKLPRFGTLLQEARLHYDWVIVDTPPMLPFADCRLIEEWIDGFLIVVAANETPRKFLAEALSTIDPAKLVGLVLNKADQQAPRYYHTYRYYYAQAAQGQHKG